MCRENLVAGKFLRYSKALHVTSTLVVFLYGTVQRVVRVPIYTFYDVNRVAKRSISGSWQKLSTLSWKLVSSSSWMASVSLRALASLPVRSLNIRYVKKLQPARVISSSPHTFPQGTVPANRKLTNRTSLLVTFTTIHPFWNISKQSAANLCENSTLQIFDSSFRLLFCPISLIPSSFLNPFPLISIKWTKFFLLYFL